jgi:hypothetical protein
MWMQAHHLHHHTPHVAERQALQASLLGASSGVRLLGAVAICALLWLAVFLVLR